MKTLAIAEKRATSRSTAAAVDANYSGAEFQWMNIQNWRRRLVRFLAGGGFQSGGTVTPVGVPVGGSIPRQSLYRVLVCRPNHRLGNLLLLTALIAELRRAYPGAQVDLIVGGDVAANLFHGFANVGTIYSLPRHALRHPWNFLSVIHKVRQQNYDLAIDPDLSSQSGRFLVNHCRATHHIGFSGIKASGQLTHAMPVPLSIRHMGQLPVLLLRWAMASDVEAGNEQMPSLDLQLTSDERAWGAEKLAELLQSTRNFADQPTIALFTHATGAKRYERKWWLALLSCLKTKYPLARMIEILPEHGQPGLDGTVPGYYSSKPRRVAAVVAATTVVLTADCGIMHLACACSGPTVVGLFCCTDPGVYGPYGAKNFSISTNGLNPIEICGRLDAALNPGNFS